MNTSTNYYDFLIDLWAITKNEKGFKAFAPIIKFHKVNKLISSLLLVNEYVVRDPKTKLYKWDVVKPTKKVATSLHEDIKNLDKTQKAKSKSKVKKSTSKKVENNIIHESDNTNDLVKSLAELGQTMDAAFKPRKGMTERYGCGVITTEANKSVITPMSEPETYKFDSDLNNDVKEVLKETVLEIKKGQRVTDLEELVAELQLKLSTQELEYQIQLDTERALQQDAIDKLVYETGELNLKLVAASHENEIAKTDIIYLHGENKKLLEQNTELNDNLINTQKHLASQEIYSASLLNTISELKDTNQKIKNEKDSLIHRNTDLTSELNLFKETTAYKVSKWFRK